MHTVKIGLAQNWSWPAFRWEFVLVIFGDGYFWEKLTITVYRVHLQWSPVKVASWFPAWSIISELHCTNGNFATDQLTAHTSYFLHYIVANCKLDFIPNQNWFQNCTTAPIEPLNTQELSYQDLQDPLLDIVWEWPSESWIYFNPSLVTIVTVQCLPVPYGKQRMCDMPISKMESKQ